MRIVTEHHVKEPEVFFPALGKILATKENLSRIRLRERVMSEDRTRIFLTWEAATGATLERVLEAEIPGASHELRVIPILWPALFPVITSVFPFSVIRPNGGVIVQGKLFGPAPGRLLLLGGFPGGRLELGSLQWGDTFAAGVIPWVAGVPDQDAFLQVVTQSGLESNPVPVKFTAARTLVMLPGDALTPVRCGEDGFCYIGSPSDPFTIAGAHTGSVWPGSGSGQDVYQATLGNGWVFDHYEWGAQHGINGGPFGQAPDPVGQPAFTVSVGWFYDVWGSCDYELALFVVGPVGMPFR